MKRLIDERARDDDRGGRIAPHLLKLKIEWGTHSEAAPEYLRELEHEVLASAIDHINDQRLRTLAPVKIETSVDLFTTGIAVDPTYGEFEEELKQKDEEARRAKELDIHIPTSVPGAAATRDVSVLAPVFYGVIGFIFGALGALIYNIAAGFVGGVEFELEGTDVSYGAPPPPQWGANAYQPGQQQYPYS